MKDFNSFLRHILEECNYLIENSEIVWDVITNEIPGLKKEIEKILEG